MRDIRQSKQYANYLESVGWRVERIDNINYFIKRFWILGSFIKIQRPQDIDIKIINKLLKEYKAFQVLIEPRPDTNYQPLTTKFGFIQTDPYLPSKTRTLDLTQTKENMLKNMHKNTRYAVRHSKADLQLNPKIENFRKAWKNAVGWKRHVPVLKNLKAMQNAFGKHALFLLDKNTNSGAIFLKTDETAYYWQAFTDKAGRKNSVQHKTVWEGILWAKNSGCTNFDFEGIYDKRFSNISWKGFSFFKKGFGGKIKKYPGAYTKFLFLKKQI